MTGEGTGDRRPLASRNTRWAQALARRMTGLSVTPNQISQASMLMAALAGASFWFSGVAGGEGARVILLILAALFCQLRLLCNLLDGMVAIEGGKGEADGPFWNEFPDRIADILIFAGIGYGIAMPGIGWAAAAFAVLTAYVRELGRATDNPSDFGGPMAKQHRMAVATAAALLSIIEALWSGGSWILTIALWIVAIGSAVTVLRRSRNLIRHLKAKG
ncbi:MULTISPECIES: CDP-alcohol phosphatidyltransferase family protein [unclassified Rhizobium]|uniref:CDP-alcohol phosphatidyltransferase family protein n=1 Tax=unclassified Rhizobium TaxID=2613769 RepID=UPI0016138F41|nr:MULTISPECIES: CDP-alcohol phosphatidyltransferase family protein [unclassified Rhizobium]MBB3385709.1 phosphatidylglycerophosphate synthase [Rhizobium sp. BK098]MBB3617414.1 phosphatidylglycerophosphate synthase [Rhizobium sp. BK609]MBB3682750.1 phosphatidylglycerophosphate synthase [Rhizobium sp. BK612]